MNQRIMAIVRRNIVLATLIALHKMQACHDE